MDDYFLIREFLFAEREIDRLWCHHLPMKFFLALIFFVVFRLKKRIISRCVMTVFLYG